MAKLYLVLFMAAAAGAVSSPPACKTCDLCVGTLPPRGSDPPCTVPSSVLNTYAACPAPSASPPPQLCPCIPNLANTYQVDMLSGKLVTTSISSAGVVTSGSTNPVVVFTGMPDCRVQAVIGSDGTVACDPVAIQKSDLSIDTVQGLCAGKTVPVGSTLYNGGQLSTFDTAAQAASGCNAVKFARLNY